VAAGILMTAPLAVRERDLRTLAGIVSDYRADLPAQGLPWSLLGELKEQIHCDEIAFESFDSGRRMVWFTQSIPADPRSGEASLAQAHWQHYWNCQPCSYPDRTGDLRSVIKIADFYSARQWHSTAMYTDLYRPKGYEHELMLTLPDELGAAAWTARRVPGPGRTVRLFLFRGPGGDFAEADRALLTLLRPHLHQAYLDAERRRQPRPDLTSRQWQVLELLAEGHTNGQIARRLGVSEGTIRTHLENIYRRLGVTSRTAAVTRALGPDRPPA
jgi:DNA-binding CsgD family transcriptional regulator